MSDVRRAARGLAILLLTAATAGPATAQDAAEVAPAPPAYPRYTVELIVFAYDEGALSGGEIFVPDVPAGGAYASRDDEGADVPVFSDRPGEPPSAPATASAPGAVPQADSEISGFDEDLTDIPLRTRIELTVLPPEEYGMDAVYEKLVALAAYRPIMRAAWIQTAPPQETAPSIRLRALGDPPPGLDGSVTLYQGRFVHLGLDLTLDVAASETVGRGTYDPERSATDRAIRQSGLSPASDGANAPAFGDALPGPGGFPALPVRYRILEVRILRDGEMRYYDHPRFGVIAKLTKVKEEEAPTAGTALQGRP